MTVDFKALLSSKVEDAKAPPVLPEGTYHGLIEKFEFGESREQKTPFVKFTFKLTDFGDDIAEEDRTDVDLSKRQLSKEFYITSDALFRLKEFIEGLGIDHAGKSFDVIFPETTNLPVILEVRHSPNKKDPQRPYANVGDVKAAG